MPGRCPLFQDYMRSVCHLLNLRMPVGGIGVVTSVIGRESNG